MNIPKTVEFNEKILASQNKGGAIFMPLADGMVVGEVDPQHWTSKMEKYKKYEDIWMCNIWCPECKVSQSILTPYLDDQIYVDALMLRIQEHYAVFKGQYCKCNKSPD
jgi:hypothetical protein